MQKKVTIKDIALACEVSTATVSRVLHDHPYIQKSVRNRVKEAILSMSYIPVQRTARNTVALIVPSNTYSCYIGSLLSAISTELHQNGYTTQIITVTDIDIVKKDFIVGAIILPFNQGLEKILDSRFDIPLVIINASSNQPNEIYSVMSDDDQCLKQAVDYLHACGHRRIALLNHPDLENFNNRNRLNAYQKEMARHFLKLDEELIVPLISNQLPELLAKMLWAKPTALICCGESAGLYVSYLLHMLNRKIPDDISLITFEQPNISAYAIPPHTTVSQDFEALATEAVNMIHKRPTQRKVLVPYKLLKRYSVSKIQPR